MAKIANILLVLGILLVSSIVILLKKLIHILNIFLVLPICCKLDSILAFDSSAIIGKYDSKIL